LRFKSEADLPTPGKEKSEDPRKNLEILFFPGDAWELDTNLLPRAYFPFKMADRREKNDKVVKTSKNKSSLQKKE